MRFILHFIDSGRIEKHYEPLHGTKILATSSEKHKKSTDYKFLKDTQWKSFLQVHRNKRNIRNQVWVNLSDRITCKISFKIRSVRERQPSRTGVDSLISSTFNWAFGSVSFSSLPSRASAKKVLACSLSLSLISL